MGNGSPSYQWITSHWSHVSNYSHGPLIYLIAAGLVWWKRKELLAQAICPVAWGSVLTALSTIVISRTVVVLRLSARLGKSDEAGRSKGVL